MASSAWWSMRSKHLAMSASRTYVSLDQVQGRLCWLMLAWMASMASWHERPGRKPSLCGSNVASHAGSHASFANPCAALSYMTGMPRGRCSVVPGVGIHTRRTGVAFRCSVSSWASLNRWGGVRDFTPSTPAVFFPRVSCVTRRVANSFAYQDFITSLCSVRTVLTSPRRLARELRCWSVQTARSPVRHGRSCHAYIGRRSVCMPCARLLAALPSTPPGSRQPIRGLSPRRWLLEPSLPTAGLRVTLCSRFDRWPREPTGGFSVPAVRVASREGRAVRRVCGVNAMDGGSPGPGGPVLLDHACQPALACRF